MTAPTERAHALLSASSAKQWIHCPPSARLREQFAQETSEAAEEGTLAHQFCEWKLRKLFLEPGMSEKDYKAGLNKLRKESCFSAEMDRYTDGLCAANRVPISVRPIHSGGEASGL